MSPYITPDFIQSVNQGMLSGVENFSRAYQGAQNRRAQEALAAKENARWERDFALREQDIATRNAGAAEERDWRKAEAGRRADMEARKFAADNPYLAGQDELRGPDLPPTPARMRPAYLPPESMDDINAPEPQAEYVPEQPGAPGPVTRPGVAAAPFVPQDMVPGLRAYQQETARASAEKRALEERKVAVEEAQIRASAEGAKGRGQALRDRDREWALRVIADPRSAATPDALARANFILQQDGLSPQGAPGAGGMPQGGANPLDDSLRRAFGNRPAPE